jgi:hypothetical protein
MQIVELDEGMIVFAVSEQGPSSDFATYYHFYDHFLGNIVLLGKISGMGDAITYHGDGSLTTAKQRGRILHTWFYDATYVLNEHNKLELAVQDLNGMNWPVKMIHPLPL